MPRFLTIAHFTALALTPPELIRFAAAAGCDGVGLRLLPVMPGGLAYPLMDDAPMLRETRAALADTGLQVRDLEIVRIGAGFDPAPLQPVFEVGASIGARHLMVAGDDPDEARLTASFAALCELAQRFGFTVDLEFMPWTQVPTLRRARRIAEAAAQPNAGVLVDAIHFARSDSTLDELAALPLALLHYAQLCDAPVPAPTTVDGMIHDARCARLLPGEGGIDLRAILARLPADLPLGLEIPNEVRAPAMGYGAWVAEAAQAARRLLAA